MIAGPGAAEHLRIYTTIDMDLQRAAYAALTKQLAALDKIEAKRFEPGTLQAALVAMNAEDWGDRGDGGRARLREEPAQSRC